MAPESLILSLNKLINVVWRWAFVEGFGVVHRREFLIKTSNGWCLSSSIVSHVVNEILCCLSLIWEELFLLDRQRSVWFNEVLRFEVFIKVLVDWPFKVVLYSMALLSVMELPGIKGSNLQILFARLVSLHRYDTPWEVPYLHRVYWAWTAYVFGTIELLLLIWTLEAVTHQLRVSNLLGGWCTVRHLIRKQITPRVQLRIARHAQIIRV